MNDADGDGKGTVVPEEIPDTDTPPEDSTYNEEHITPEITDMLAPHCAEEGCGPKEHIEEHIVPEFKEEATEPSCIPNCAKGPEDFITPEIREPEPPLTGDGEEVVRIVSDDEVADKHGEFDSNDEKNALEDFELGTGDLGEFEEEDAPDADATVEPVDRDGPEGEEGADEGEEECAECSDHVTTTTTVVTTQTTGPADEVAKVHAHKVAEDVAAAVHGEDSGESEGNAEEAAAAEASEEVALAEKLSNLKRRRSRHNRKSH